MEWPSKRKTHQQLFGILILSLFAVQLFIQLIPSWEKSGYYDYGWLVPVATLILFIRRTQEVSAAPTKLPLWLLTTVFFSLTLLVPIRLMQEVDPLWRLPLWLHAGIFLFTLHAFLAQCYGKQFSVHCLPASLLILTAVPLPGRIEIPLIEALTNLVVSTGHELLLIASNFPIDLIGQRLIVRNNTLDVADACSGIKSFQAALTIALILGEVCRGSLLSRLSLVFICLLTAIAGNIIRVYLLGRIAFLESITAANLAHDSLSFAVLICVLTFCSVSAWFIHRPDK